MTVVGFSKPAHLVRRAVSGETVATAPARPLAGWVILTLT